MPKGNPPGGHGTPSHGPRGGPRHKNKDSVRRARIDLAVSKLQNELIANGLSPSDAQRFAKMALSQQGVSIGRRGGVHYKGEVYNAQQFADSPLLKFVTGEKAKAANLAALESDPNYQMALSQLGLTRDQSQAALDQTRRQALIDYGDPNFVSSDPTLAAAVAANPFSTSRLQQEAYDRQRLAAATAANRAGVTFGGGAVAGQQEAQRSFAGGTSTGVSALQGLLDSITQQTANLGQNYSLGQRSALLQTEQNLTAQGLLQSVRPPTFHIGQFKLWRPPRPRRRGGSGVPPPPPPPPGSGGHPGRY